MPCLWCPGCGDREPTPAAEGDLRVVRGLIEALNAGDSESARAVFAAAARFRSVGRVYPDQDAIFSRFLDPGVIAAGGRYTERSARVEGDRLVVEYDFTTRGGGSERFSHGYCIESETRSRTTLSNVNRFQ